jgi:hypothetical protein
MLAEPGVVLADAGHRLAHRAGHPGSSAFGRGCGTSTTTTQAKRARELSYEEAAFGVGLRGPLGVPDGARLLDVVVDLGNIDGAAWIPSRMARATLRSRTARCSLPLAAWASARLRRALAASYGALTSFHSRTASDKDCSAPATSPSASRTLPRARAAPATNALLANRAATSSSSLRPLPGAGQVAGQHPLVGAHDRQPRVRRRPTTPTFQKPLRSCQPAAHRCHEGRVEEQVQRDANGCSCGRDLVTGLHSRRVGAFPRLDGHIKLAGRVGDLAKHRQISRSRDTRSSTTKYRHDRARRTLHGIDEQVAKAEKAVAGKVPVKRNRFITLTGATKAVNRQLEAKARALAGLKGYVTNLPGVDAQFVIDAYHRLFQIERSFRMSKHDLRARPIYHHKRASIEAHLSVVFAALAVSRWIEDRTGWSIKKFVRTARRYRTIQIQAGEHTLTADDPLPDDLRQALKTIHAPSGAH